VERPGQVPESHAGIVSNSGVVTEMIVTRPRPVSRRRRAQVGRSLPVLGGRIRMRLRTALVGANLAARNVAEQARVESVGQSRDRFWPWMRRRTSCSIVPDVFWQRERKLPRRECEYRCAARAAYFPTTLADRQRGIIAAPGWIDCSMQRRVRAFGPQYLWPDFRWRQPPRANLGVVQGSRDLRWRSMSNRSRRPSRGLRCAGNRAGTR